MLQDIDYAAEAVKKAILDKFGRSAELQDLTVAVADNKIVVRHGDRLAAGSRDELLAALRKADSYDSLWQLVPAVGRASR